MSLSSFVPLATSLRSSLRGYDFAAFKCDFMAAFVVSLIALPLSMALSIAVGLPPQHGIYTAIVAGFIVPLLGGSIWQVSGPTAAFVVILAPIVNTFGLRGIIWASVFAGVILIIMGISRLGRLIKYVPYPVTTGFTAGIAVVLATISLNDFLGLNLSELKGEYIEKVYTIATNLHSFDFPTAVVGITTLTFLFIGNRISKVVPNAITAMVLGTLVAILFNMYDFHVATIGTQFSYTNSVGDVIQGIPTGVPVFHLPNTVGGVFEIPSFLEFKALLFPSFTIAILASIESLLSASVADIMTGTKHSSNAELVALGIGNIFSASAMGISATGAIARTTVNINSAAKTPLASSMHALFILFYVSFFSVYISYIPMAALAALLIYTAYRMSHYRQAITIFKIASVSDIAVFSVCFFLTVFIDMVVGVGIGIILAAFLLIRHLVETMNVVEIKTEDGVDNKDLDLPRGTILYRVNGPLFFGTIEKTFDRYRFIHDYIDKIILDFSNVPFIDMTGLVALKSMLHAIANENRIVYIVCSSSKITESIIKKIKGDTKVSYIHFFETLDAAFVELKKAQSNESLSEI